MKQKVITALKEIRETIVPIKQEQDGIFKKRNTQRTTKTLGK